MASENGNEALETQILGISKVKVESVPSICDLSIVVNNPFPYTTLIGKDYCPPELRRLNEIWISGMKPYGEQQFSLNWAKYL